MILVTGCSGYIGKHICEELIKRGEHIKGVDLVPCDLHIEFIQGDLMNIETCIKALDGVDKIIHLAAYKDVQESVKEPRKYLESNVISTLNLLELIKDTDKKLVFASSAAVMDPRANAYGMSKAICEELILQYIGLYKIKAVILRYFNVYGKGSTSVIDLFINNIRKGKQSTVYSGCTRDYVYIDDVVKITVNALEDMENNLYEIGTGEDISTCDLYEKIQELMESKIEATIEPKRDGDIETSRALFIVPEYEFISLGDGLKHEIDTISKLGS